MQNRKELIFNCLRNAALMIGSEVTKERLQIYTENAVRDFQNMPLNEIKSFFHNLARTCRFFPSYAEILEKLNGGVTERDAGLLMAGEIIKAIGNYGQYQTLEAKEYLGEQAWFVVERFGGWGDLCKVTNSELPTVRAQLRDMAAGAIKLGNKKSGFTELENKARNELLPLNKNLLES